MHDIFMGTRNQATYTRRTKFRVCCSHTHTHALPAHEGSTVSYLFSLHQITSLTEPNRWWIKRYVLQQKYATLEPLYNFEKPIGQREINELFEKDRLRAQRRQNSEWMAKRQNQSFIGGGDAPIGSTPIGRRDL